MPSTMPANAASHGPPTNARRIPAAAAATATIVAARTLIRPAGIGLPALCPASLGASTTSLTVPIAHWRSVIDTPRASATGAPPPATIATSATTTPSRTDGNGWTSRAVAATSRTARPTGMSARSDVDQLVEVRHEVVDQPVAPVRDLRADPGDERPQRHRGDDEVPGTILADRGGRSAAGCEHPFEFGLVQLRRPLEVLDDADDATALRDVAHELRCPGVDLGVGLV